MSSERDDNAQYYKRTIDPRTLTSGLLRAEEAAAWLGVSRAQFYKLKVRQVVLGPQCVRYDVRDLMEFADANGNIDPMRRGAKP